MLFPVAFSQSLNRTHRTKARRPHVHCYAKVWSCFPGRPHNLALGIVAEKHGATYVRAHSKLIVDIVGSMLCAGSMLWKGPPSLRISAWLPPFQELAMPLRPPVGIAVLRQSGRSTPFVLLRSVSGVVLTVECVVHLKTTHAEGYFQDSSRTLL